MPQLLVEKLSRGMRDSERLVTIRDVYGQREFLRVEYEFLTREDGKFYLPVGMIFEDKQQQLAIVELPQEGERGNWRLVVRTADLLSDEIAT